MNLLRYYPRRVLEKAQLYKVRIMSALGRPVEIGALIGAVTGSLIGIVPGVLLLFIASNASYDLSGGEILSFFVISIVALTLSGAVIGGVGGILAGLLVRRLSALVHHPKGLTSSPTESSIENEVLKSGGGISSVPDGE